MGSLKFQVPKLEGNLFVNFSFHFLCRTWQDWGLRNARKTAFHAAVNFYCKQLGITSVGSLQPITFPDAPWQSQLQPQPSYYDDPTFNDQPQSPLSPIDRDRERDFESTAGL